MDVLIDGECGGKIRTIDFGNESAGTQHILDIVRSLLSAFLWGNSGI